MLKKTLLNSSNNIYVNSCNRYIIIILIIIIFIIYKAQYPNMLKALYNKI